MKKFAFLLTIFLTPLIGSSKPVVLVVGTRPEAIKMLPVYQALKKKEIPTILCSTGQHAQLLKEVFSLFKVKPDIDFKIMRPNQDLFYITESVMQKSRKMLEELNPALVVVQGDTTSAMATAMTAFYLHIPIAHVEAGLRSHNIESPFPEEMNRRIISMISTLHFPPTHLAETILEKEGILKNRIFRTGNTVVDALHQTLNRIGNGQVQPSEEVVNRIKELKNQKKKIILLTAHRRESFDGGLHKIFSGIKKALTNDPNLFVIYPRHPNPKVSKALEEVQLDQASNIWITPSMQYHDLLYIMNAADGVATDSGGIQEEAISLNKSTLVLRHETGRPEGITGGLAQVVGTNSDKIAQEIGKIKRAEERLSKCSLSPYGDGHAGEMIAKAIETFLRSS